MKSIFIDTNIILDVLAKRFPYDIEAKTLFEKADEGELKLFISALSFANVNYIITKSKSAKDVRGLLKALKLQVTILDLNDKIIELALNNKDFKDIEDGFQYYTALESRLPIIITRNKKDFGASTLPVLTPKEFLASI